MVSNAMEATIWIKVECLDFNPQMADNFEISLYLTDLTATSLESGRDFEEVCFVHTCILISVIRFWKTYRWNMHIKAICCHCIIMLIYLYRFSCDFMNPAFSSTSSKQPWERVWGKKTRKQNHCINSQNCQNLERQMLKEGKEWVSLVLVLFT